MLSRFVFISGTGWLIDFLIFALLSRVTTAFIANLVGASVAVLFVFFASLRPIFSYSGRRLPTKLLQYVVYQVGAITLASLVIDMLSNAAWGPLGAKIIVTPFTFMCNFLFMRWLAQHENR